MTTHQSRGLGRFVNVRGGLTESEAEDRARLHLEMLKPKALGEIDQALQALAECVRAPQCHVGAEPREEIRGHAYKVASLAGTFGFAELGRAAYALCDLLDLFEDRSTWDWSAVRVHFDVMRFLRDLSAEPEKERLLSALDTVANRFRSACP